MPFRVIDFVSGPHSLAPVGTTASDTYPDVLVKFNHPSFTGLAMADDASEPVFNRVKPVTFIRNMLVYYGDELVSRLRIASGIADDPLFIFKIKATKEADIKVVFIDNFGKKWEATKKVKFKG